MKKVIILIFTTCMVAFSTFAQEPESQSSSPLGPGLYSVVDGVATPLEYC